MRHNSKLKTIINLLVIKGLYKVYVLLAHLTSGHQYFATKKIKLGSILIASTFAMCTYHQDTKPNLRNNITSKNDSVKNQIRVKEERPKVPPILTTTQPMCYYVVNTPIDTSDKEINIEPDSISVDSIPLVEPMCYAPPEIIDCYASLLGDSVNKQPKNPK